MNLIILINNNLYLTNKNNKINKIIIYNNQILIIYNNKINKIFNYLNNKQVQHK